MRFSISRMHFSCPVLTLSILVALVLNWGCAARHRGLPLPLQGDAGWSRGDRSAPLLLKIGLLSTARQMDLTTSGSVSILSLDGRTLLATIAKGERIHLGYEAGVLSWNSGSASGIAQSLLLRPGDPDQHIIWRKIPYPGEMRIIRRGAGLTLINIVELEEYLRGVVPWEIGRIGPSGLAALEAQAIAARTYSISHLKERESMGFDMWASVKDQVYRGAKGRDEWCDRAISNTAGLVMRHKGQEIEAYYYSTCGGSTSSIEDVWARGPRSYLRSHADNNGFDDFCVESPHYRWTSQWSGIQLSGILQKTLVDYLDWVAASPKRRDWVGPVFIPANGAAAARRPGILRGLSITERTSSGRVAVLEIRTDAGVYRIRGDRVRWVLAPQGERFTILRSASIELNIEKDAAGVEISRVLASGRGFGHGIGLCQTGATGMARQGFDYKEILKHYYPGATVVDARNR